MGEGANWGNTVQHHYYYTKAMFQYCAEWTIHQVTGFVRQQSDTVYCVAKEDSSSRWVVMLLQIGISKPSTDATSQNFVPTNERRLSKAATMWLLRRLADDVDVTWRYWFGIGITNTLLHHNYWSHFNSVGALPFFEIRHCTTTSTLVIPSVTVT